jgi:uncharacterized Zn finger protein (UPF0148 family)
MSGNNRNITPDRGTGRIKCVECGSPLRDHSLTVICPVLEERLAGDRLVTDPPVRANRKKGSGTRK